MTNNRSLFGLTGATLCVGLILSACSSKATDSSGSEASEDLKTGPGVTADTITLGVLSDLSGIIKANGLAITHGNELWVEEVNEAGGICGRDIALDIQDTQYKPDLAVPAYAGMKDNVAGTLQLLGSPLLGALKGTIESDNMLVAVPVAASANLDTDSLMVVGPTYDVDMINGLAYLQQEAKLKDGDKVGVVYVDSELGQNGLLGVKAYAEEHDLTLVEAAISSADADMTATVTKMKAEGVNLIAMEVLPPAAGSIIIQNQVQGLSVPLLGGGPSFATSLVANSEVVAGASHYYVVSGLASVDANSKKLEELREAYEAAGHPDEWTLSIPTGYVSGKMWQAVLEEACEAGDLSREGIKEARSQVSKIDGEGVIGDLDLSTPGAPPTRTTFIAQIDPSLPGKLTDVGGGGFESPEAESYKAPYQ